MCLEDLNLLELFCNQRIEPQFLKYCYTNEFSVHFTSVAIFITVIFSNHSEEGSIFH